MYLDRGKIYDDDRVSVNNSFNSMRVSTSAPDVKLFEGEIGAYLGTKTCVATNSGTSALHLALIMAGVKPGDDVVIPAITFKATENAVRITGANPAVCDVDRDTWLMTPDNVAKVITTSTKAIIPVHLYGCLCEYARRKKDESRCLWFGFNRKEASRDHEEAARP